MRNTWIVTYDVCDAKRLRRVFKTCKGRGAHLQYSVFECDLDPQEKAEFEAKLHAEINDDEDQVLFIDLGPAEGRGNRVIHAIGLPYYSMDAPCYAL
ncbi:MAG: CRISPR-associated endonuclease Cas2 [Verrucomicrobiales bacterium]